MKKGIRIAGMIAAALVFSFQFLLPQWQLGLPDRVYTTAGETTVIQAGLPISVSVSANREGVEVNGQAITEGQTVDLSQPIEIQANSAGETEVVFSWAGMTLRKMTVKSEDNRKVVPGGDVVGVALYTKGALVVGTGDITTPDGTTVNPGKDAGILPGDVILSINGTEVEDSDHLTALINGAKEARRKRRKRYHCSGTGCGRWAISYWPMGQG